MKTFPFGGIHPSENKITRASKIAMAPMPEIVSIPLSQHIGAPAQPVVAKGDKVVVGQKIGEAQGFVSANIHASVSGEVIAVDNITNGYGIKQQMIVIRREGDVWQSDIDLSPEIVRESKLASGPEIIDRIREKGIVGMGGAAFPSHVKLSIPEGKRIDTLIINGVECEPYLTSDHRMMLERGEELLIGVTLLMKALGVNKSYIGIENNKRDAIEHLSRLAKSFNGVNIVPLKVQYPQGGEKQLIAAITGRQVPPPFALPADVGCVVSNVSTTVAIYEAVQKNKALVERVVTITGKHIKCPANMLVRVGTPIASLLDIAGGLPDTDVKVVNGGPMMGRSMSNLDSPVVKGCSGVLVLSGGAVSRREESACIKCAKCVGVCPMKLEPFLLSPLSARKMWDRAESEHIIDCIECGSCQYICPANIPLLDYIRLGKQSVTSIIRGRQNSKK